MHYLYDIWMNWFDGEEEGYFVYPYHEWRKTDDIEVVEQIPLLYITETLFDYIENRLAVLPQRLLNIIYRRAYFKKGHQRQLIDYACVVTDGQGILAIHTLGYKIPLRKSRLIPRHEQQVYELIPRLKQQHFSFLTSESELESDQTKIDLSHMVGLTRRERQLKRILLVALEQLKKTNDLSEIYYWMSEWENKKVILQGEEAEIQLVWERIFNEAMTGWSDRHENFCAQIVKRHPILLTSWEIEQNANKNKENQK